MLLCHFFFVFPFCKLGCIILFIPCKIGFFWEIFVVIEFIDYMKDFGRLVEERKREEGLFSGIIRGEV